MERTAGLLILRNNNLINKRAELEGFLAIFHPEISAEKRHVMCLELSSK
jgi:hypothetical protein